MLVLCLLSCILVSARENEGQWTVPSEIDSPNVWMAFRKDVDVKGRQETAVAKIAVDSKYWLWVNGLITYDRKVVKVDESRIRTINQQVCNSLAGPVSEKAVGY